MHSKSNGTGGCSNHKWQASAATDKNNTDINDTIGTRARAAAHIKKNTKQQREATAMDPCLNIVDHQPSVKKSNTLVKFWNISLSASRKPKSEHTLATTVEQKKENMKNKKKHVADTVHAQSHIPTPDTLL